jgi:ABC-type Mn2+/Zn2+ transport system permease subunit
MFLESLLIEPFQYEFMRNALIISILAGIVAPLTGYWALTRRMVYLTDAMSHSVLPGVIIASMLGVSILVGAMGTAIVLALVVSLMVRKGKSSEDGAVGVASQALFALGVVLASRSTDSKSLSHYLFGNPLSATFTDIAAMALTALAILLLMLWAHPMLIATSFDPEHASAIGVKVTRADAILILALAGTTVIGLGSVGVLMTISLSVGPAVITRIFAIHISKARFVAMGIGVFSSTFGVIASYHLAIPVGPAVALTCTSLIALSFAIKSFTNFSLERTSDEKNTEKCSMK